MFFVIALITLCFLLYLFDQHKHSYWKKRGFPQLEPKIFVGDIGDLMAQRKPMSEVFQKLYNNNKRHKLLGIYMSYSPSILVTDPIMLQNIMISNFSSFHDRPVPFDIEHDPLQAHLFNIPGQKWRDLRVKLSPTFTSGKLKGMFPTIRNCGEVLEEYLMRNVKAGDDVFEFRDLMARFNTNIISSVGFGIENDCINDRDHIFRKMGIKAFEPTLRMSIAMFLAFFMPQLLKIMRFKITDPQFETFIYSIVNQNVEYREKNKVERNDFFQLLLQLKNQGYVTADRDEKVEKQEVKKIDMNDFAANCNVFFQAGFETSSSTMSYCLYELAKHPEIQKKVQEEIDEVFKKRGAKEFTYETMNQLKYLECCIDETLRKYPIVPLLMRLCTEDYKVPDTDQIIPKGMGVMIPVMGFHRDPEIYDDPMSFIPERFLDSSNGGGKVKGLFYVPFGDGPRNCIGMRLGKVTSKVGLAVILSSFSIEFCDKTMLDKELEYHPKQFILTPLKEFNLKVTPRLN